MEQILCPKYLKNLLKTGDNSGDTAHNDYTLEVPPKFEFFDDRIEITFL